MSKSEQPVHCLAVQVFRQFGGKIDIEELESFLNASAGRRKWMAMAEWLFTSSPISTRPGVLTVPVLCPEAAARQIKAAARDSQRIRGEHIVVGSELRRWRCAAFQIEPGPDGSGDLPWEVAQHD